mmetsp:Transcript_23984/g.31885  ORF Transcript_23984/g.31885 Transcript_23984/m.31885 type:complete len:687 (-) Transcript_23984:205-2265(-)
MRSRRRCFQGYYPLNRRRRSPRGSRVNNEYTTSLGVIVPNVDPSEAAKYENDPATIPVHSNSEGKKAQWQRQDSIGSPSSIASFDFEAIGLSGRDTLDTNSEKSTEGRVGLRRRSPRSLRRKPSRMNSRASYSSSLSDSDLQTITLSLDKSMANCDRPSTNNPLHSDKNTSIDSNEPTNEAPPSSLADECKKKPEFVRPCVQTIFPEETDKNPIVLPKPPPSFEQSVDTKANNDTASSFYESFTAFRLNYLIVHIAIMLADGLQGTHLYVLYEGYGYSVASLYCLGFVTGAFTSPFIGPLVDKVGRKRSAMLYCALEMMINYLEQMPHFMGLIVARMVGGITTNLLFSVFETWLVTEHRRRGFAEEKLETILRDSVIASNLAAIVSGWIAHVLAAKYGPVGPFEGAVTCTAIALVLVALAWTENYGSESPGTKSVRSYMGDAVHTIVSDSKISRIGIIQGLTEGSLQTFVFLWSPALRHFATKAPMGVLGLDENGEPAYGLIFGAFMACGVIGGFSEHLARKAVTWCVTPPEVDDTDDSVTEVEGEGKVRPVAVEFLASISYFICAGLLFTPFVLSEDSPYSFSIALAAFLVYEFMVGLYMPCEGVIRSIYMPTASMCSLMTMLRVVVNVAVALGVVSTNFIPFPAAFASVSCLMVTSAFLQLSLVSEKEWRLFIDRLRTFGRKAQ